MTQLKCTTITTTTSTISKGNHTLHFKWVSINFLTMIWL